MLSSQTYWRGDTQGSLCNPHFQLLILDLIGDRLIEIFEIPIQMLGIRVKQEIFRPLFCSLRIC